MLLSRSITGGVFRLWLYLWAYLMVTPGTAASTQPVASFTLPVAALLATKDFVPGQIRDSYTHLFSKYFPALFPEEEPGVHTVSVSLRWLRPGNNSSLSIELVPPFVDGQWLQVRGTSMGIYQTGQTERQLLFHQEDSSLPGMIYWQQGEQHLLDLVIPIAQGDSERQVTFNIPVDIPVARENDHFTANLQAIFEALQKRGTAPFKFTLEPLNIWQQDLLLSEEKARQYGQYKADLIMAVLFGDLVQLVSPEAFRNRQYLLGEQGTGLVATVAVENDSSPVYDSVLARSHYESHLTVTGSGLPQKNGLFLPRSGYKLKTVPIGEGSDPFFYRKRSLTKDDNSYGFYSKREHAETSDKPSHFSQSALSHPPKSSPAHSHSAKLLSSLNYFNPDKSALLPDPGQDVSVRQRQLKKLMESDYLSPEFRDQDTVDVLYWGLENGQLSEYGFLDYYHALMVMLQFHPEAKTSVQEIKEGNRLAESIRLETYEVLEKQKRIILSEKAKMRYQQLTGKPVEKAECFVIRLSEQYSVAAKESGKSGQKHSSKKLLQFIAAINFFERSNLGMQRYTAGEELAEHLIICPYTLIQSVSDSRCCDAVDRITPYPTFSYGGWDELKKLRQKQKHPIALWHPRLKSMTSPDGRYIGTLSHIHDFYHVAVLNHLGPGNRSKSLTFDFFYIQPLHRLLEYLGRKADCPTASDPEDKQWAEFLHLIKEQFNHISTKVLPGRCGSDMTDFPANVDRKFFPAGKIRWRREFVDQDFCNHDSMFDEMRSEVGFVHCNLGQRLKLNFFIYQCLTHSRINWFQILDLYPTSPYNDPPDCSYDANGKQAFLWTLDWWKKCLSKSATPLIFKP